MKFKEGCFPAAINLKSQDLALYVKHPGYKIILTWLAGKVSLHIITSKYHFPRKVVLFCKSTMCSKGDGKMDERKNKRETGIS